MEKVCVYYAEGNESLNLIQVNLRSLSRSEKDGDFSTQDKPSLYPEMPQSLTPSPQRGSPLYAIHIPPTPRLTF